VAIRQYCVDDSWDIYSFDIDPQPDLDLPKHKLIEKAVWTSDGKVEISLDPRKQATHIKGIAGTDYSETRTVPSMDFSRFVHSLPPAVIVCSMDIEGAEFPVLRKMIKDGTARLINILDVEFHHRMMPDEDKESARKLIRELSSLGVIVRLKVVL
jgi:FkbM family methyltransferase